MKIFVVDDNEDICTLVETLLVPEGYSVTCCVNPMIAEEMIRKTKPNLIITDMLMSGVDGLTLIKNLKTRKATKDIKIILMSAHPQTLKLGKEAGADDYLAKPFEITELIYKVRKIIQ